MITWLVALAVMCERGLGLSQLVGERQRLFPVSGEINREIADSKAVLALAQATYQSQAKSVDFTDGLSMEFEQWRFNLRGSNTEPLVRLNVETRGSVQLMQDKTAELLKLLDSTRQSG
jgi:phosphomannomutase/phosphomannomutase/phosphoglucomutase